jgi:outer membrane protein assembly factor BamB
MHKYTLPLLLVVLAATVGDTRAADWSNWRGPQHNGTAADKNLPDAFSSDPADNNNLLWRAEVGGRTTPIVQGGHVYFLTKAGDDNLHLQERVVCLDEKTGKVLWEHKDNVFFTDVVGERLGWTSMAGDPETGYVYAHGTQGFLTCYDKDGKQIWRHSLTEEYGRISGYGGRISSPIVDGDLVILSMVSSNWGDQAIGRTRFVAFNKKNGAVVWWASTGFRPKNTYSSVPMTATINGERLVIGGGGDGGVHAFKAATGEHVWSYIFGNEDVNISAVVDGSRVYIGHGDVNTSGDLQGRVICLDASKVKDGQPELVWQRDGIKAKFASPIFNKGRLYICNDSGFLYCLNADDGKTIWQLKYGKSTKGSPVLADGKIYIGETDKHFYIFELQPGNQKPKLLHDEELGSGVNGSPAVVNGHVYFMATNHTYCVGKKDAQGAPQQAPPAEPIAKADASAKPAHIQVQSTDVVLFPGQSVELKAVAFDAKGRLIGPVKVDWSLAGPLPPEGVTPPPGSPPPPPLKGELSDKNGETTKLTVSKAPPPGQFGRVLAKLGDLTGEARVRVAPTLPLAADFSKVPEKRIPGGWTNTQGKFEVVNLEGRLVLQKTAVNPSPLVARANAYLSVPNSSGYTIEAEVRGDEMRGDLPDMGVIACRYHLFLYGKGQQLRLVSWDAVPRIDNTIVFPWKAGAWYHMKLTTEVQGDTTVVRGKVWPKGSDEPKDWLVEVKDPIGNKEGSPGLYGNALSVEGPEKPGTPIYYDNVKVTSNKK